MPIMDGLEVLKALRKRDDLDDLPVIILSTTREQKDIDQCFSLGAKYFISKPSSFTEFVAVAKSFPEYKS